MDEVVSLIELDSENSTAADVLEPRCGFWGWREGETDFSEGGMSSCRSTSIYGNGYKTAIYQVVDMVVEYASTG